MFRLAYLTSNNIKIRYLINYAIIRVLYITQPIATMFFIDSVVALKWQDSLIWGAISIVLFVVTQTSDYFLDVSEGLVISDNFVNIFSKINHVVSYQDLKQGELKPDSLNQTIGQNYELIKQYVFIKPVEVIYSILTVVAIVVIMFFLSWKIALVIIVLIPVALLLSNRYNEKISRLSGKNVDNMKNVKEYISDQNRLTREERLLDHRQMGNIGRLFSTYKDDFAKKNKTESFFLNIISYGMLNGTILIAILLSGYFVYKGEITIGVLYVLQSYTSQLWSPSEFLLSYRGEYFSVQPVIDDLCRTLGAKVSMPSREKISQIELCGFVPLDQNKKPLTKQIYFKFEKGKTYLITGENGIGKTTLIETILGYSNRFQGQLLINGKDNNATDDFVYIPAAAYISKFFSAESCNGSSGQKKLLQILNCIKTKKTVYIFDEPTNYLDSEHKKDVIDIIRKLASDENIIIVVSHDPLLESENMINLRLSKA